MTRSIIIILVLKLKIYVTNKISFLNLNSNLIRNSVNKRKNKI